MMELQKKTAFRSGFARCTAVASLLFLLPAAGAESQQNVVSELSTQDEIQKFCTNIADAARDQRYLMQKQELEKLQADVNERISALQDRKAEYEDWLARRNHFLEQAKSNLVDIYKTMKADAAAPQLEKMHVEIAAAIIMQLPPRQSGLILSEMDAQKAAIVAGIMSQAIDKNTSKDPS
ncbi:MULTISPECIES: MotE family protein [Agrobacterium]|uniref:MotE family protein n=1 Tax=Agrobacterium TaxID=357 RepID=UPI002783F11F|nr:MotE family protein [Agrobacterium sp. SORGH_AS_0745]MDP9761110.1 flagellar motility protein MotE (MotC chaperone) [Agrobacterium tumefaciens]MDQ1221602.1 flagellar motility protein MotE (MotC chaperone) [Agrobacterium sp. SORGH_AS_0745]